MTHEQEQPSPELYPGKELVALHMGETTRSTAVITALNISQFKIISEDSILSDIDKKARVKMLDTIAANNFEEHLDKYVPFRVNSVGSEGMKEVFKDGMVVPIVMGEHGSGEKIIWIVNDVVEGTTAAAHGRDGAISVLAASEDKGLMPTPDNVNYMEKLAGPPEVAGKISLEMSLTDNLMAVKEVFGVSSNEINVVMLERARNRHLQKEAQKFGANLKLIQAGDLVPGLLAATSPTQRKGGIYLLVGSGGWEEGVINAAAARASGGVFEGREWIKSDEDPNIPVEGMPLLTLDQLVPGRQDRTQVIYSPITRDPWLNTPGVTLNKDGTATVHTVIIDENGINIQEQTIKAA